MKMKKSQIEMMGFAIIVILVIIGIFLLISFRIMSQANQPVKNPYESFAINFVSVFALTDTSCGRISDLIQDCALERTNFDCPDGPCVMVEDTANTILDKTLKQWGVPFEFIITKETPADSFNITHIQNNCNESMERFEPAYLPISLWDGVKRGKSRILLTLCIER